MVQYIPPSLYQKTSSITIHPPLNAHPPPLTLQNYHLKNKSNLAHHVPWTAPKLATIPQKKAGLDICGTCYVDGRFPSSSLSSDFIKITASSGNGDWSDAEVLLLLEGLELFSEDWNRVSDHVKTRGREECIVKFLKLPIEDDYVGSKEGLGPLQYHNQLFSSSENPVLSLAAFLGSAVDPGVASAAAKAAIDALPHANGEGMFASGSAMEKSAAAALGASAAKAHSLAKSTEQECAALVNSLVQTQMTLMDLKLKHFETLEAMLDQERRDIQGERVKLYAERVAFRKIVNASTSGEVRVGSSFASVGGAGVGVGKSVEYVMGGEFMGIGGL